MNRIDDSFGHWLAGFTDGEGAFVITRPTRPSAPHVRVWPNCRYEVSLRADDYAALVAIRDTLGFGNLNIHTKPNLQRPNEKGAFRYVVARIGDCLNIVELFHRYPLRAKKRAQFLVWADAVHEMAKGRDRNNDFIEQCRIKLTELRQYVEPEGLADIIATNPEPLRHRRDYGIAPTCRCGCGGITKILASDFGVPHPDNPNYSSFIRGHGRRSIALNTT